jgi:hypothetical protein
VLHDSQVERHVVGERLALELVQLVDRERHSRGPASKELVFCREAWATIYTQVVMVRMRVAKKFTESAVSEVRTHALC